MTADLFEDPGQSLLARGTADPIDQLRMTRAEEDQLDAIREQANEARTLAHVALVLGGAFLLYRHVVERATREELSREPESRVLQSLALRNARNFIPAWVYMVTPALETAYTIGAARAGAVMMPDEMVQQFAVRYASDIANYFNETSAQALTEGFNTYVNRQTPRRIAAEKALQGFGLNSKMMRALVGRAARGKIDSPVTIDHNASVRDWIELMLVQRAHDIGENEGFNAAEHGKQITWLYLQKTGRLSPQALKVWHTARDERVCPACGPLDKTAVPIDQPFVTTYGKIWVPSMHPNCRCQVRLRSTVKEEYARRDDFTLAKADWDPAEHPRGVGGRFRRVPRPRVGFAEPPTREEVERETELARLLREVEEREAPVAIEKPVSLTGAPEGKVSLGPARPVSLGRAEVSLGPVAITTPVSVAAPAVGIKAAPVGFAGITLQSTPVQLAAAGQQAINLAYERIGIALAKKPKPVTAAPPGIIDLPESLYYLDTAGFHHHPQNSEHLWYDDDENQYARFEPEHEFTTHENVMDQIRTLYNDEIEAETRRIMTSGRNFVGPKTAPLQLDRAYVKASIEAEITNAKDAPELRAYAAAMGVSWRDPKWHVRVYRMDRAYANGFVGEQAAHGAATQFFQAPGDYYAEEELLSTEEWGDLPVTTTDVEPEEEEARNDDFRLMDRDDWPPS